MSSFNISALLKEENNNKNSSNKIEFNNNWQFSYSNENNLKYQYLWQMERRRYLQIFLPKILFLPTNPFQIFFPNRLKSPFHEDFNEKINFKNLIKNEENENENDKNKKNGFVEKRTSYKSRQRCCVDKRPRACFNKKQVNILLLNSEICIFD